MLRDGERCIAIMGPSTLIVDNLRGCSHLFRGENKAQYIHCKYRIHTDYFSKEFSLQVVQHGKIHLAGCIEF